MDIYSIGRTDFVKTWGLEGLNQDMFVWLIAWYHDQGYDGDGELVLLARDGRIFFYDISHTGGYNAVNSWEKDAQILTQAEYLDPGKLFATYACEGTVPLREAVRALLIDGIAPQNREPDWDTR